MKRALVATLLLSLALAGPAMAAPVNTPGVAFIKATQSSDPDDGDPEGDFAYNGATGPAAGNVLTILETGNKLEFTAPLTLILPSPFAGDQISNCKYGLGHLGRGSCTMPGVGTRFGYPSGCSAEITGNAGADDITLRRGPAPNPYVIPTDCWYIFMEVVTKDGDDVIRAHNDGPTRVVCGAGFDRVVADSFDDVSRDCESVSRI
jgi:hypothetical protein